METYTRAEEGMDAPYFGAEMKREGSDTDVEVDLEKKGSL